MKSRLTRSRHPSHSKRGYNGIYVGWEQGRKRIGVCPRHQILLETVSPQRFRSIPSRGIVDSKTSGAIDAARSRGRVRGRVRLAAGTFLNCKAKRRRLGSGLAQKIYPPISGRLRKTILGCSGASPHQGLNTPSALERGQNLTSVRAS